MYEILEGTRLTDPVSRAYGFFITVLILLNVAAVVLSTVHSMSDRFAPLFDAFEVFSVAVFTVEYALRLWSCVADPKYAGALGGRLRYAMTPMALIDLAAVLPFYLPMVITMDLRAVRVLRLLRLLRLMKMARYTNALGMMAAVFRAKREELTLTLFIVFILLILTSTLMYYAESAAQPERFSSIPAAMWWSIITLTTIGYGDVFPVTVIGKVIAGATALLGIGMIAIPAGILSSGLVEAIQQRPNKRCPHCAKEI